MHRPIESFDERLDDAIDTAVAITGMSCRFAGARSPSEFWSNLQAGVESISQYSDEDLIAAGVDPATIAHPDYVASGAPLTDMECFDASLFGLSPRDASIMDPQHRHFLECTWEALEDAGHTPARFSGAIGVFAGSGHNAYLARNLLSNPALVRQVGAFLLRHTGNDKDFLTTRASYLLDLRGPSVNVQTACSTSLVAVHMAVQHLLSGECDLALAGGVSIELPHRHGYMHEDGGILSPDGHCRPFDAGSQGTIFGSGVGVVVLRRLRDAIADGDHIHAVIRGSAVNNDGSGKVGYLAPSVDGQASVVSEALSVAGIDARTIGYVEAHGTGTPVGDPIEIAALTQAYRRDTDDVGFCAIGSVKANIGHTDTAAGVASLIKVAMALQHRQLPPSLNFTEPNPACEFADSPFRVNTDLRVWPLSPGAPRRAGVSSLGVGGTNAHVVMEEAPGRLSSGPSRSHQLIAWSAASPTALDANGATLATWLSGPAAMASSALSDAAYTLNVGRQPRSRRRIMIADSVGDAAAAMTTSDRVFTGEALADRTVAFMFCGAGSQYAGMAAGLYDREPVFRAAVDECLSIAEGGSLRRWMFPDDADAARAAIEMERPSIALPALFTIQVALARLWISWGVSPAIMIGHSSGEYAAAHVAGVIALADALRVVTTRGALFETLPEGGMLSVPLDEAALLRILPDGLSIAAVNGAESSIASGAVAAIGALEEQLTMRGIESRRVRIAVAAHSAMLDPVLGAFRACLKTVRFSPPTIPFVSNLTGCPITAAEATDPEYWVRHLRQTVRFTDGLQHLAADPTQILLEVGPGRTMASLARQHPARAKSQPVLGSLRHPDETADDTALILTTLGRLWTLGVPVDWDRFWAGQSRHRLSLPTYSFDRSRHWIEPGASLAINDPTTDTVARYKDIADWFHEPVWRRVPAPMPAIPVGTALLFADAQGLSTAMAARLIAAGRAVTLVRPGRRYTRRGDDYTIDPADPDHYHRLLADLAADNRAPEQIHHCWLVTGPAHARDARRRAALLQDLGLYSLLFLTQALADEDRGVPVRIAVVTDGMQRISEEPALEPAKATILGAAQVAARELSGGDVRSIDVTIPAGSTRELDSLAGLLLAELAGAQDDDHPIAYRAGERWSRSFEPMSASKGASCDNAAPVLRTRGVYLITGGLGGIGLTLARHLAQTCGARIALMTRTGMPPRGEWDDLLATRGASDPMSQRIRQLLSIEAAGGEAIVIQADVADARAVRRAVRQVRARFGRIDGVFHAAGVLDDQLLQLKTRAAVAAVLAPKLFGTLALDAALRDDPPDLLVLFSSISAFAGIVGQVDYAAANAFLDAFAQSRIKSGARVIAIDWSQWQGVGMATAFGGTGDDAGADPHGPERTIDHPFLTTARTISADELIVTGRLSPDQHWLLDEHRLAAGQALVPGSGWIELVRAAFAERARGPVEMSDVTFLAPFTVPDAKARDLQIRFRPDGDAFAFTVLGRMADASEAGWSEHACGRIAAWTCPDAASVPIATVRARCAPPQAPGSASPFMAFGPRWQVVRDVALGTREALVTLALPAAFAADLPTMALHPALLDFATAGAQALIPGVDPSRDFFAPLSYGRLRMLAPLPAVVISHIRLRADAPEGAALAVFDVTLTDPAGTILVDIADFTMIKVRDPALLGATMTPPASMSQARGITPREGMQVIDRILNGAPRPQLVVSPEPLAQALKRLHPAPRTPVTAGAENAADAPRSPTERLIAHMWGEMLGIDHVGHGDNFFDLGGHSLLAVQFTNRLRKRGKTLPLAALLETPTVARLAAIIDRDGATSAACGPYPSARVADVDKPLEAGAPRIVTLRDGGRRPPLFLVHDGLGETMLYRSLALRLTHGHAVYGLEPDRLADGNFAHTAIAQMASAYVARVRRVRPQGPYLIAGLCAGGVIAFEMARQMEDAGDPVAFVGILDAADVEASGQRFFILGQRMARLRGALAARSLTGLVAAVPVLLRKAANALWWEATSRLDRRSRARTVARMAEPGQPPAGGLTFLQLYEVAHRAHRPHGLLRTGQVTLFRASTGNGAEDDIPFGERYSDCILGWGRRVAGDVALVAVPGGHTSILQVPHVDVLARVLQDAIDTALSDLAPGGPASDAPFLNEARVEQAPAEAIP